MPEAALRPFSEGIWVLEGDRVRMLGVPFGTRMTLVRLGDGKLWVHSPVKPSEERLRAVEGLGPVGHLVAPNKFHHLFIAAWSQRFPDATAWADRDLQKRRADLQFGGTLEADPPSAWEEDIDQVLFAGSAILPETVFFHRISQTLIVTDILQNHEPSEDSWFWRTIKGLNGILAPEGGAPRDWRMTVRDKDAARHARDQILRWPIERLILCHGRCLDRDARPFVERAFAWLDR